MNYVTQIVGDGIKVATCACVPVGHFDVKGPGCGRLCDPAEGQDVVFYGKTRGKRQRCFGSFVGVSAWKDYQHQKTKGFAEKPARGQHSCGRSAVRPRGQEQAGSGAHSFSPGEKPACAGGDWGLTRPSHLLTQSFGGKI